MAATNADVPVPVREWTLVNAATFTGNCRVQNVGGSAVHIQAKVDATLFDEASDRAGAIVLDPGQGHHFDLAADFPGVSSAAYLQAYATHRDTKLSVSHA